MRKLLATLLICMLFGLAFAGSVGAAGEQAAGDLKDKDGKTLGKATLVQNADNSIKLTVQFNGLPAGQHGIHFHTVGKCDGPDFMTAGGHFNPASKQHGLENPAGPHAGDAPNLNAPAGGSGTYEYTSKTVTISAGANSLFDADGTALVIHANADDNKTDPAGNSGGRIACAVLQRVTLPAGQGGAPAAGLGGATQPADFVVWPALALGVLLVFSATALAFVRRKAR